MKQIAVIFVLFQSFNAFSWGSEGHRIIAQLCKAHLKPEIIDSVQKHLGETSFEDASTWMDDVRRDPQYNFMKSWHYVNVPKDETYIPTVKPNIINVIENAINNLKTRKDTKTQLLLLFHLIGDLHQPLHTGYKDDRGGNEIDIVCIKHKTNLHHAWDTDIIKEAHITTSSVKASQINPNPITDINIIGWMNESRALLPNVYAMNDACIDHAYIKANTPIINKQLYMAAVRLAYILTIAYT